MKISISKHFCFALLALSLWGCGKACQSDSEEKKQVNPPGTVSPPPKDDISSDTERPDLKGLMVFHSYSSYGAMDSKLYLYDFREDRLSEISRNWTSVTHPMNGHLSPDATHITFMGIGLATNSWDIFIHEIGSDGEPQNITAPGNFRDEDPKYSFDGKRITFKRNDALMEYMVDDGSLHLLASGSVAFSMPYYSVDGMKILYGGSLGSESFIGCWDRATATASILYDKMRITEYYPVTADSESFYYTQHYSENDNHDQLYKGYFDGRESLSLPFNNRNADYSDAGTISDGWLLLSSTRYDSRGAYDLYIANERSGAIYSLSAYNMAINSANNELGASYRAR